MNIRKYLVTAPGETHTAWKPLALEECQNVKLLHLYNCQQGVNKGSARCYTCTIVSKVSTKCQQGVNKLSARCKICNHLSMKNMQVIFSVFVCICVCICNFLEGGTRSKKNILKNGGGGEPKYEVLIIEQSLRPITLWGSVINQNWSIIKGWQGVQRASSPNNFPLRVTRRYCPRHDL